VRAVGTGCLRYHPESFIGSNIEYSWLEYLNNMSIQGTWCDNLITEAVANALNCTIYITIYKELRVDKKPVYFKNYYEYGIVYVNDLLFDLGNNDSFRYFAKKN